MKDNHKEFRLTCDCHTPTHFIQFDYYSWEKYDEDYNVFFCSGRIGGFWERVRRAAKYIFGTQELVTGDICISKEKVRELAAFLNEVAGE